MKAPLKSPFQFLAPMSGFRLMILGLLFCVAPSLFGQSFTISSDAPAYKSAAGQMTFTVTASYPGTPGALGFRIVAPLNWTFASVSGTNPPNCLSASGGKQNGSDGFEFYFITPPDSSASFKVTLN